MTERADVIYELDTCYLFPWEVASLFTPTYESTKSSDEYILGGFGFFAKVGMKLKKSSNAIWSNFVILLSVVKSTC